MTSERPLPLENLLAQSDWVTSLARALVADAATAEDIAQATWVDVMRSPPRSVVDPRAWLAAIVRRKAQKVRRTNARRIRRELVAAAARTGETAASAAELAQRLTTHRELVDAVLTLDEPYRETVVLRFFENLDLETIGKRTQSKHNTVRSRLQRGLQQLRERLDRAPGGRERWLPAVLVLGQRRLVGEVAGVGLVSGIALSITMKKFLFGAGAIAAGLLCAFPLLLRQTTSSSPIEPTNPPAVATTSSATTSSPEQLAAADSPAQRSPTRIAAAAETLPERRLVDHLLQPLPNITLRATTPFTVRWQGGDRGWISGPDRSMQISAATEDRLLTDAAFAQQFFAEFEHADEWRATVLGTPLPAREVASAADGSFQFAAQLAASDAAITVSDPAHVLVEAGATGKRPWIAGRAARLTGTVRDSDGKPLADSFVMPMCPTADGAIELHGQVEPRTDDDGCYIVRRGLANGLLRVRHEGFETAFVPTGAEPMQRIDVTLQRRVASAVRQLDGMVVDGGGQPIAGASVWFGRQQTTTAANGRFTLPADGPKPQYALTIVAKGYSLLQLDDLGAALEQPGSKTQDLLFVLTKQPLAARGLVLDSNGAPLAGALVGIVDPTILDISFQSVEARVGGWNGGITTAADGTFSLAGLTERAYRFRAIDPATGAMVTSPPQRADAGYLVLRLPQDVRRNVRGTVLDDGRGLAGARVEIGYCTYVTKGGGTQFDSAPTVACDAEGHFLLPVLPRNGAWLGVLIGGSLRYRVPVETFPADGDLTVTCDDRRWLQLVGSAFSTARSIHFEAADGSLVAAAATLGPDGDAPVLAIPDGAVAVVIDSCKPTLRRLELTDDRAVLLRVR